MARCSFGSRSELQKESWWSPRDLWPRRVIPCRWLAAGSAPEVESPARLEKGVVYVLPLRSVEPLSVR